MSQSNLWDQRGSLAVSRLVNHHPRRVSACGFLAVGYYPPVLPNADIITRSPEASKIFGYDVFAFMRFFTEPDAATVIEKHVRAVFIVPISLHGTLLSDRLFHQSVLPRVPAVVEGPSVR